jgi:radical SAM superfamily enzyme YgiQ (UPF0313 family)
MPGKNPNTPKTSRNKVLVYTSPSKESYVRLGRCAGSTKGGEKWPPIKLMYLAGASRQVAATLFIDADAENISEKNFLSRVGRFKPDFLVLEPTPPSLKNELRIIRKIKSFVPGVKVIFTGSFANAEPGQLLDNFPEIDFIIVGESEITLMEFLSKGSVEKIKGMWYRKKNKPKFTGTRPFLEDLDQLPFPAHDVIPLKKYSSPLIKKWPFTVMETSRGCPFKCTYCNSAPITGKKIRFRSPKSIIEEMKTLKKLGVKEIKFNDETFAVDKKRISELFRLMKLNKLKFSWKCNSRVDVVNEETLRMMKKNGCHTIFFGIESGNQEILNYYRKGLKKTTALKTLRTCRKLGITTVAHFIFGAPMESKKTVKESVDFAIKLDADYVAFNLLTPFPGTELYKDLQKRGMIHAKESSLFDQSKKAGLKTYNMTPRQLEQAMKKAYKTYYFRPRYVLRKISKLRNPSDLKRNLKGLKKLLDLTN